MKIKLKRAARLGGHDRGIGTHEIHDDHCKGWFFEALIKEGKLEILEEKKPAEEPLKDPAPEAPKLDEKSLEPKEPSEAQDQDDGEESEDPSDEAVKPEGKKAKKKKSER